MAGNWFLDVDGVLKDFNVDLNFLVTTSYGTGMPKITNLLSPMALQPGSVFEGQKINERHFSLQGSIVAEGGENKTDVHDKRQALIKALMAYPELISDPLTLRTLRYTGATVTKEIQAVFDGGLDDEPPITWSQEDLQIRFIAPDPLFNATSETTAALDSNDTGTMRLVMGRFNNQWDVMGPPGAPGTAVYTDIKAIAEDDIYVYFGGNFANFDNTAAADYIVRWHKANEVWSAIDSGLSSTVDDLIVLPNGNLVASGLFTNAGGDAQADYLAQWNGSAWSDIGDSASGATVSALPLQVAVDLSGNLWYVGDFTNLNGIANADRAAYWDGASWNAASTGPGFVPNAIAIHPITGDVYVAGNSSNLKYWNGATWTAITPTIAAIYTLAFAEDGTLYAGGETPFMSSWNGSAWSDFADIDDGIRTFAFDKFDNLLVGGDDGCFATLLGSGEIGLWNGSEWTRPDLEPPASFSVQKLLSNSDGDIWLGSNLASGAAYFAGKTTVAYGGTYPAYPYIEIDRSGGTSATIIWIRNELTGATIYGNYSLSDGEKITFEFRPQEGISITSDFHGDVQGQFSAQSDTGQFYLTPKNASGNNNNDITIFIDVAGGPTITSNIKYKVAYISLD